MFLDVERFTLGGQLNTPARSYMLNLDIVGRYGNTDSTSFGPNTQYTIVPLSTNRPATPRNQPRGSEALASVVPDGVATVSWTLGCPSGRSGTSRGTNRHSETVIVPVVNNVAAKWFSKPPADCPGSTNVVWRSADGRAVTSFGGYGNLPAPPFVVGKLGRGTRPVLTTSGIGDARIGASASEALTALTRLLGPPADADVNVQGCASDRETVWTSPAVADPLTMYAQDGRFIGYQYGAPADQIGLKRGPGAVLATQRGLLLADSIRTARGIYPSGFATQASPNVGYWSAVVGGGRFYGAAIPNYYPARTVAAGDRVATIGAGAFPACPGGTQSARSPAFVGLVALGSHASLQTRALYYLGLADQHARQSGACARPTAVPETERGAPTPALLAALAVLRNPRAVADELPGSLRGNAPSGRFVQYIRLATTAGGLAYYVVPSSSPSRMPLVTSQCIAASVTAADNEVRRLAAPLRARVLDLIARLATRERETLARQTGDAVCLLFAGHDTGGGTCGATAADVRDWGLVSVLGPLAGIVPDGVATVTIHYPAGDGLRAVTASTKVVNNVFVTSITRAFGTRRLTPTILWRSASGRVLKTVPGRVAGVATSGWCSGC